MNRAASYPLHVVTLHGLLLLMLLLSADGQEPLLNVWKVRQLQGFG